MKRASVLLTLVLMAIAAVGQAEEKTTSPAVMLQEAIYAEETEGNLDKAIKLYQKVVQDAAEIEKLAAQATFRIGMCYLKKGDKDKAFEYFEIVTSKFADQKTIAEQAKAQKKDIKNTNTFENSDPYFSVSIPSDWQFSKSESNGQQFSLQLVPPKRKVWAVLAWQKRGFDPASESATTIAKADCEQLKGFFEKYTPDNGSWKEFIISGLEAAQFWADYQDKGSLQPKIMVEYRTYIVDESNVYWFVFRIERDQFEVNKSIFNSIVNSFVINEKAEVIQKAIDAAQVWLGLIDKGQYAKSWDGTASLFKKAVTRDQWTSSAQTVRQPLGTLISREVLSKTYTRQAPGAPDGEYVILTFKASYENKKEAIETVTPMLDHDGQWRVSGYYIK